MFIMKTHIFRRVEVFWKNSGYQLVFIVEANGHALWILMQTSTNLEVKVIDSSSQVVPFFQNVE